MLEFLNCHNSYMQEVWATANYKGLIFVEAEELQPNSEHFWWDVRFELLDFINEEVLV